MATRHDLDGLMKWVRREDWREAMTLVLDDHVGPACETYDLDADELAGLIGAEHMMTLWGCAFEDLLTCDFDGRNLADEYLKRRGWKETAPTRAYIAALRQSVMSLYEVSGIRRDEGFFARDLLRGGEPVWVSEKSATHCLAQWDRLAARLVTVNGRTQMAGGVLTFEREASADLIARFEELTEKPRNGREAGPAGMEAALARGAFVFSSLWLSDALGRILNPPEVVNSDGEPVESIELRYPLARGVKQADVAALLSCAAGLRQGGPKFWNWVREEPAGRDPAGPDGAQATMLTTRMDDGATVLGCIELRGRTMTLSVNSEERAQRGRGFIETFLGTMVGSPQVERRTLDEMMEARSGEEAPADALAGLPEEERAALLQGFYDDHYARVLNEPVPMLGNKSPRDAARSSADRAQLLEWLKLLDNSHARTARGATGIDYDCGWIWQELGLGALRRS